MDVIYKTDARYEEQADKEWHIRENVLSLNEHKDSPGNHRERKDDASATEDNCRMRTSLVRFIDDVALVRNAEINQLRYQQKNCNNYICQNHNQLLTPLSIFLRLAIALCQGPGNKRVGT